MDPTWYPSLSPLRSRSPAGSLARCGRKPHLLPVDGELPGAHVVEPYRVLDSVDDDEHPLFGVYAVQLSEQHVLPLDGRRQLQLRQSPAEAPIVGQGVQAPLEPG